MVGLIEDASRVVSRTFKQAGDVIVLLGDSFGELGGSEYLKVVHAMVARPAAGARPASASAR